MVDNNIALGRFKDASPFWGMSNMEQAPRNAGQTHDWSGF